MLKAGDYSGSTEAAVDMSQYDSLWLAALDHGCLGQLFDQWHIDTGVLT